MTTIDDIMKMKAIKNMQDWELSRQFEFFIEEYLPEISRLDLFEEQTNLMSRLKAELLLEGLEANEFTHQLVRLTWDNQPFALVRSFSSYEEKGQSEEVVYSVNVPLAQMVITEFINDIVKNKMKNFAQNTASILDFGSSVTTKINLEENSLEFLKTHHLLKVTGLNIDNSAMLCHVAEKGYGYQGPTSQGFRLTELPEAIKGFSQQVENMVNIFSDSKERLLYWYNESINDFISISRDSGFKVKHGKTEESFMDIEDAKKRFLSLVLEATQKTDFEINNIQASRKI